jgi:hypothetical protein
VRFDLKAEPLVHDALMAQPDDLPNLVDNRWLAWRTRRAMHRGVRRAVRDLEPQGVIRAIPFLGFHVQPVVWLVTRLDAERHLVTEHGIPRDLVVRRLEEAGVRPDLAARAGVTVESEETVQRDYDGNWRVAGHPSSAGRVATCGYLFH